MHLKVPTWLMPALGVLALAATAGFAVFFPREASILWTVGGAAAGLLFVGGWQTSRVEGKARRALAAFRAGHFLAHWVYPTEAGKRSKPDERGEVFIGLDGAFFHGGYLDWSSALSALVSADVKEGPPEGPPAFLDLVVIASAVPAGLFSGRLRTRNLVVRRHPFFPTIRIPVPAGEEAHAAEVADALRERISEANSPTPARRVRPPGE